MSALQVAAIFPGFPKDFEVLEAALFGMDHKSDYLCVIKFKFKEGGGGNLRTVNVTFIIK